MLGGVGRVPGNGHPYPIYRAFTMFTRIEDAVGKKLCGVAKGTGGRRMVLVFDDGSKCQLSIDRGYEYGDEEISDNDDFDPSYYRDEVLLATGVVDANFVAERERLRVERERAAKERQEAKEAEEYERLKRKFESR
jgi:hypothetical protein